MQSDDSCSQQDCVCDDTSGTAKRDKGFGWELRGGCHVEGQVNLQTNCVSEFNVFITRFILVRVWQASAWLGVQHIGTCLSECGCGEGVMWEALAVVVGGLGRSVPE